MTKTLRDEAARAAAFSGEPFSAGDSPAGPFPPAPCPARALWACRTELAQLRPRIEALHAAVNFANDFSPFQWAQLTALVLDWRPDLILELGRKWGNSTCAFTEAAAWLAHGNGADGPAPCRVASVCRDPEWEEVTLPKLRAAGLADADWLSRLTAHRADITRFDFAPALAGARRVLVFWDAHGWEVAATVLGGLMPRLAGREHLVALHDLSDQRYGPEANLDYAGRGLWAGRDMDGARLLLGHVDTAVPQAVCALDFCTRNRIGLESAEHELRTRLDAAQAAELARLLGPLFSLQAHWFHFSLNHAPGAPTFPRDPAREEA